MLSPDGVRHKRQGYFKFKKLIGAIHHISKPKEKIHTVIVIGIENTFNKIQYPFPIKSLSIIIENFPNLIKVDYKQSRTKITTANIALDDGRLSPCALRPGVSQGICSPSLLSDVVLERLVSTGLKIQLKIQMQI